MVAQKGRKGRFSRARWSDPLGSGTYNEIGPGDAGSEENPAESSEEGWQGPAGNESANKGDSSRAQLALKLPQARNHGAHLAAKGDQIDFHNFSTFIQFVM